MAERGRPKGANGEESRMLLLKIAAREFAQSGFHKTKVSSIVKGASVSQPTFYLYFKNKQAIFEELENLFHMRMIEFTKKCRLQPMLKMSEVRERNIKNLKDILDFLDKNPYLTQIGFYLSERAENIKAQIIEQTRENFNFEVQAGYFRQDINTQMFAECLMGIVERLTLTQLLTKQKSPEQLAESIVDLLLQGMLEK